jgi:predicted O-linked N-acetylglucosamine transferase (SPINDLY family)
VLVDLAGYTKGVRTEVLALQPAPVQARRPPRTACAV